MPCMGDNFTMNSAATIQRYVARISLIVSGTKRCKLLTDRPPCHCHLLHTAATLIHTMDKDICFQTYKKRTKNNLE